MNYPHLKQNNHKLKLFNIQIEMRGCLKLIHANFFCRPNRYKCPHEQAGSKVKVTEEKFYIIQVIGRIRKG